MTRLSAKRRAAFTPISSTVANLLGDTGWVGRLVVKEELQSYVPLLACLLCQCTIVSVRVLNAMHYILCPLFQQGTQLEFC